MAPLRMFLAALFLAVTGTALEEADGALITPAPRMPSPQALSHVRGPLLNRDTSDDGFDYVEFCYGMGGICDASDSLLADCDKLQDDEKKYNQCLCGNGAIAVSQRCDWCQEAQPATGIPIDFSLYEQDATSLCSSYGFSVAPVPASIISLQKDYNASYTGVLPGTKDKAAATGKATASASKETGKSKSGDGPLSTISYISYYGGGGGSGATVTGDQPQPSAPSVEPTGAATATAGWRAGDAALFSFVLLVVAGLFLM